MHSHTPDNAPSSIATALRASRAAIACGVLLAGLVVASYEWFYASDVRAHHRAVLDETARITAANDEVDRTLHSEEATAAWVAHVQEVDAEWAENLKRIPPAELVEAQYDKLAALTARSGIKQLSFERLNLSKSQSAPGAAPTDKEPGTSVSPAIEVRRVKVAFLANVDSLGALLAEVRKGVDERMLSVSEYQVAVSSDAAGYSMRVEMIFNLYFKKRDAAAAA